MTVQFIAEGRIVWGHPAKAQKKTNPRNNQVITDPNTGQPVQQWVFGLAIPKDVFEQNIRPYLNQEAASAFPSGTPQNFSWKFKDGDTEVDGKGKPYREYEGRAGCMILTISTEAFQPPIYKFENNQYVQLTENDIKCGDYVAVKINSKFNGATGVNTPGLYINPEGVVLIGYGTEIITGGEDPEEMFAGYNFQTPAGASATPTMGNAPLPQNMQTQPQAQPVQQQQAPQAQPVQQQPGQYQPQPMGNGQPNAAVQSQQTASNVAGNNGQLPPPATGFAQAQQYGQPVNDQQQTPQGMTGLPTGR